MERLRFGRTKNSMLTCWHRPQKHQIQRFADLYGITMVITMQRESESPELIEGICEELGLKHFWIDLLGASQRYLGNPGIQKYLGGD